jgi:hypothetical protein
MPEFHQTAMTFQSPVGMALIERKHSQVAHDFESNPACARAHLPGSGVFARWPFPGPGGKLEVSTGGGKFPAWSGATYELLFLANDDRVMAAGYTTQGDSFTAGIPRAWSPMQIRRIGAQQSFDVSPDGKRVAMFPRPAVEMPAATSMRIPAELLRRGAATGPVGK